MFIAVTASTAGVYKFIVQSNNADTSEIPNRPDVYQVAYLRDGKRAVAQLVCWELLQKGFLRVKKDKLERSPELYNVSSLNSLEKSVFDYFEHPQKVTNLKYGDRLKSVVAERCETYKQYLTELGYLNSLSKSYLITGIAVFFIILNLGSYQLDSALANGYHDLIFPIIMSILSTIWIITSPYSRVAEKGEKYLANLKQTFSSLNTDLKDAPTEPDYNSSLLLAIFGIGKLNFSHPYQDFVNLLSAKFTYSSSSSKTSGSSNSSSSCSFYSCNSSCGNSCGGGCGSSCGSSCGGGCGGCGGGCGGCGGGCGG